LATKRLSTKRLLSIVERRRSARARELYELGAHPDQLSRAVHQGLHLIVLACTRIPKGVVCLKSSLAWHGMYPTDSAHIWMAVDRKAKKPVGNGQKLRLVRFSGEALTQGVVNARIDGVAVRIYSVAKTIADCLKYRKKMGRKFAAEILQEVIARNKCSEQRLRHFAKIRRVGKLVQSLQSQHPRAIHSQFRASIFSSSCRASRRFAK
jgi:predicted transcriptional regulator of viral defense system